MRLTNLAASFILFLLYLVLGGAPPASAQTTLVPDCGYLNARPCHPFDNEAYNIYFGFSTQCDFGLYVNIHNKCVPTALSRDTISKKPRTWAQWALAEQRYRVGANVPINMVTTFGTHNSFSSYDSGFHNIFSTNQKLSLFDQLEAGARSVRIDAVKYFDNMRVCHMSPGLEGDSSVARLCGWFSPLFSTPFDLTPGRLYAYSIRELADWLDRNPNEFIILNLRVDYSPDTMTHDPEQHEMVRAPLLQFIGRDRILTPGDLDRASTDAATMWPTMQNVRVQKGKQVLILASRVPSDYAGNSLAFGVGRLGVSLLRPVISPFPTCIADPQQPHSQPELFWADKYTRGVFYEVGEGRSGADSIKLSGGYMNAPEVREYARCSPSIINVDFLLHQELSILPASGQKPDQGPDYRREASIWSFEENDYGSRGAAYMKESGRWSSDPTSTVHPYACVLKSWAYPRNIGGAGKVVITQKTGPWFGGESACTSEYGPDFGFYAPGTARENELLKLVAAAVDPLKGVPVGQGGVWLNYVSTAGNLLSLPTKEVTFAVDYPDGADAPQSLTIDGPPNERLGPPAVVAQGNSDIFVQSPGEVLLDSQGHGTFTIALRPNAAANKAPGVYANRITYYYFRKDLPPAGDQADSNNSVLNQAIITVNLFVKAKNQFTFSVTGCSGSVCNFQEAQPIQASMVMTRPRAGALPIAGETFVRSPGATADGVPFSRNIAGPFLLTPGPNVNGFQQGFRTVSFALPPGSHQVASSFAGGPYDEAVISNTLTINVAPILNPQPTSITQRLRPRVSIPATAATVTINNPANRTISLQVDCGTRVSACWLSGSGTGNLVTLRYTTAVATLEPANYIANVTISDGQNAPVVVPFMLTVAGTLTVTPQPIHVIASRNPEPVPYIATVDGFAVPVTVQTQAPWLSQQDSLVIASPGGLPVGTFTGSIRVSSTFADSSVTVPVNLQVVPQVTVGADKEGVPFTVDGATYTSSQTFAWVPGTTHTLSVPLFAQSGNGNFLFNSWSNGGSLSQVVTAGSAPQSYLARFDVAHPLTTSVTPVGAGSVSVNPAPSEGFYRQGSPVSVLATPARGYVFAGYQGDLSGITNPQSLLMTGPRTLVARFALGSPVLVASPAGTQADGNSVKVNLLLLNRGSVPATAARITGISGIRVLAGTGTVTPLVQASDAGNIAPGASGAATVTLTWPPTATRIQFTVEYGDASGYRGSNAITLFR